MLIEPHLMPLLGLPDGEVLPLLPAIGHEHFQAVFLVQLFDEVSSLPCDRNESSELTVARRTDLRLDY